MSLVLIQFYTYVKMYSVSTRILIHRVSLSFRTGSFCTVCCFSSRFSFWQIRFHTIVLDGWTAKFAFGQCVAFDLRRLFASRKGRAVSPMSPVFRRVRAESSQCVSFTYEWMKCWNSILIMNTVLTMRT